MKLNAQTPKQSLNKAFLKQPVNRDDISLFKTNLQILLGKINENESEEHHKNFVRDFLKDTFYKSDYEINTKGRQDLVIHVGKDAGDKVGVILEAKKPTNRADMISADNPNRKALHELVLYFLRERIDGKNADVKYLIVTNINEWFIFDASVFNQLFFENKTLVKDYKEWRDKQKTTVKTDLFYNEIAKPYIEEIEREIPCTYFDIRNYEAALNNADWKDGESLIELFKILSPHHLLKVPFADDSNRLDKNFYTELLHIIGLEEIKDKGKLKIQRKDEARRNAGSLIENTITIIKTEDLLPNVANIENYGEKEERLFNVALDLCLTWINRILFLKLLEAQLVDYHKGNRDYRFLDVNTIKDFDGLYRLFHQVLAINFDERIPQVKEKFWRVPYLNSSLFEFTDLEKQTLKINGLNNGETLNLINTTVLKEIKNRRGELLTLEYLFAFLDAYDFASEGAEGIKENNRSLINASVLGKVFEKINGYKDGSIYTPGFITMYMCRQAIRLAVVQKFKDAYGWKISEFADIKNYLADRRSKADILEFNALVNSLHLCDPAVGSGHFLVSSLNEIIAIKSELGILADGNGERFRDVEITVENDELTVFDISRNDFFKYQLTDGKPNGKEAQRLQKTLFHEKQTLIENCLFGVDINPNSVKICRLRLWIELLKNAYYKESSAFTELETLPNIDINIKEGNSLVSRFALDEDLKQVLSQVKYSIEDYRNFVLQYKETRDREKKRDFEAKIKQIKSDFKTQLFFFSPERRELADFENQLRASESKQFLFGETDEEKAKRFEKETKLKARIEQKKAAIKQIEENAIYKNAFEWRFEFPEVLDNNGNFLGFDIVIGNPPYGVTLDNNAFEIVKKQLSDTLLKDSYFPFILKGLSISNTNRNLSFIIPNTWRLITSAEKFRNYVFDNFHLYKIDTFLKPIFEEAVVDCDVIFITKTCEEKIVEVVIKDEQTLISRQLIDNELLLRQSSINTHLTEFHYHLIEKINDNSTILGEIFTVKNGIKPYEVGKGQPPQTREIVETKPFTSNQKENDSFLPLIGGSNFHKYILLWNDNNWISYGNWLAAPRDKTIFEANEKIIVRQTSDKIIATKIGSNFIVRNNTHIILKQNDEINLLYLLALLNSKLVDFIYWTINPERGEALAEVKAFHLEKLPIKQIEEKDQQPFVALVDQILELKKAGKDTQALEDEIDTLVYRLYDLTDEEIAIVEGK